MYKKIILFVVVGALSVLLTACSQSWQAATAVTPGDGTPAQAELSDILQLAVGTFQLEETDQAVQADQAAVLLPLWQAYSVLSTSDTVAQVELDALVAQIQETMTAEQNKAISDMQLTARDMMELNQTLGLGAGSGGPNVEDTPEAAAEYSGATEFIMPSGGAMPSGGGGGGNRPSGGGGGWGGGMPGGGGDAVVIMGGQMDPTMLSTLEASGRPMGGGMMNVNPQLFQALIDLLEKKIQPVQ